MKVTPERNGSFARSIADQHARKHSAVATGSTGGDGFYRVPKKSVKRLLKFSQLAKRREIVDENRKGIY